METLWATAITLFLIMDPLGNVPIFLVVLEHVAEHRRRYIILRELIAQAREMGLKRVFCMTFEEPFFGAHGFEPIEGTPVGADVFSEMLRSHDDGLAEFLDLARVKPNTLGNARMLLHL